VKKEKPKSIPLYPPFNKGGVKEPPFVWGNKIPPFCKGGIKGGLKNEKEKAKSNPPVSPFNKGGAKIPLL
jgi:hypothetical protein